MFLVARSDTLDSDTLGGACCKQRSVQEEVTAPGRDCCDCCDCCNCTFAISSVLSGRPVFGTTASVRKYHGSSQSTSNHRHA